MKKIRVLACLALWCASLFAAPFIATNAVAAKVTVIRIVPHTAWAHWLPNAQPATGYFTLQNPSIQEFRISSVSSPDYEKASFKQSIRNSDGTTKIVDINGLLLPGQGEISLNPNSYQVLLERPTRLIAPGDNVRVILQFSTGDTLKIKLPVRIDPV